MVTTINPLDAVGWRSRSSRCHARAELASALTTTRRSCASVRHAESVLLSILNGQDEISTKKEETQWSTTITRYGCCC